MEFVIAFVSFMAGPLLVGLGLTLGLEHLLLKQMTTPPAAFWRRPVSARLAHVGYWCASWSLYTLITQRPWFSLIVVNALWLVVLQVSHTKYVSLREPFLSQDFEYFTDAIKHPRLYIPFFGIGLTIAATTARAPEGTGKGRGARRGQRCGREKGFRQRETEHGVEEIGREPSQSRRRHPTSDSLLR